MNNIKYNILRFLNRLPLLGGREDLVIRQMRKEGVKIGLETHIFSNIASSEPYLVSIGNNCTISTDVSFLTHDASVGLFLGRDKISDICGEITIGNNCFIGNRSILLYGISIPDNTIVAAGSVVTKNIVESGCIVGGNPAKIIGRVDDFINKSKEYGLSLHGLSRKERREKILNSNKLIHK